MAVQTVRRLPGFRFEVQAPPSEETLPRMDVAVFAGFAASGPLHTPVAVEDVAEFNAVFGADAPLAWDSENGRQSYAHLAPAVRGFFRNGGRRCWIIRVADESARSNYFPIPNLAVARFDSHGSVELAPACATARSEGSWSDSIRLSTALLARPIAAIVVRTTDTGIEADLLLNAPDDISEGALLRVSYEAEGYALIFPVETIEFSPDDSIGAMKATVSASRTIWFRYAIAASPPLDFGAGAARIFTKTVEEDSPALTSLADFAAEPLEVLQSPDWSSWTAADQVTFDFRMPLAGTPDTGSLIRIDYGDDQFWLAVQDYGVRTVEGSSEEVISVTGQGIWLLTPPALPTLVSIAEVLTFDLKVRLTDTQSLRVEQMGFHAAHQRFWANLPADIEFYEASQSLFKEGRVELSFDRSEIEIWPASSEVRFPLAASAATDVVFLPIAMPFTADQDLGRIVLPGTELERDGLSNFDAALFLDAEMIDAGTSTLMSRADFLRYLSSTARKLKGIHAALGIEEATIVAVPDATQRGWIPKTGAAVTSPPESLPPSRPEWWPFLDCDPAAKIPRTSEPEWQHFLQCGIEVIAAPLLFLETEPDSAGTFALSWTAPTADVTYILEEATEDDFSDAVGIYSGSDSRMTLYGRSAGEFFYRVYARSANNRSDWSNTIVARVSTEDTGWEMLPAEDFSNRDLLAVHRCLLRMCAARGDLMAVLTLPEHYREDEAISYVETLKSTRDAALEVADSLILPLSSGESGNFSHAAVYHPWVAGRESEESTEVRSMPPDGVACGVMAHRSISRGAWIAPANEKLTGVVTLTPLIERRRLLDLQGTQINVIRQEPRGFLWLSADTLSDDPDLRPINVRRLLMLLRRVALKVGARYVFEPNSDSFRRSVQRGFEAVLDGLFVRGAFAGATPAKSYQVVTDASLNTPASVEQGRFIVELKVAPSLPMTFLTIRLVQTGDKASVTEGS